MRIVSGILIVISTLIAPASSAEEARSVTAAVAPAAASVEVDEVAVPEVDSQPAAEPQRSAVPGDDIPEADTSGEEVVAELEPRRTSSFGLLGVTWDGDDHVEDLAVEARTRVNGAWQPWRTLHVEDDHGDVAEDGRAGTEATWVGESDGVAVRLESPSGETPDDVRVMTIDPGENPAPVVASAAPAAAPSGLVPRPTIVSRSTWGARSGSSCDSPRYGSSGKGAVIHHTAGTNSYSKSQSAGIVRAVQAYHQKGRDWCDIGYNVLVDKYGQVFEGRAGGLDRPVRAAHSGNGTVNEQTMGVSLMGNFSSSTPGSAMKDATVDVVSWRMATYYLPATGKVSIGGKSLNRISGHRDVVGTACPGARAYAWLSQSGGLRSRVADRIRAYSTPARTEATRLGSSRTGPVTVGEKTGQTYGIVWMEKVDIYHHVSYGTKYVDSKVRTEYRRVGSSSGALRYPTSNRANTSTPGVSVQRFQQGDIWRVTGGRDAAYALHGPIATRYSEVGGPASRLGEPRSPITTNPSGSTRATFQRGRIDRTVSGIVVVSYT